MRRLTQIKIIILSAVVFTSCAIKLPDSMSKEQFKSLNDGLYAQMETTEGAMTIELFEKDAPLTVANFVGLAEGTIENQAKPLGTPFYDGLIFHRIIKDFMIQGGDPKGTGTGGPGYSFEDEFFSDRKHDGKGVLSMANSGPNSNGSQFFITEIATPWLDGRHTVFGKVIEGIDVVDSLAAVKTGSQDKPKSEVKIDKLTILRKGKEYDKYKGDEAFVIAKEGLKKKQEEKERKAKEELEKRMQEMAELKKSLIKTDSGLQYAYMEKGQGEKPVKGDSIKVHYLLSLENGTKVDSSYDRKQPLDVQVGMTQLIMGWMEALTLFERGSKVLLVVPPQLGYGAQGAGGVIPPNATLFFEMEILD